MAWNEILLLAGAKLSRVACVEKDTPSTQKITSKIQNRMLRSLHGFEYPSTGATILHFILSV